MINPIEPGGAVKEQDQNVVRKKLQNACQEFEALFITYLLKSREAGSGENSFFGQNKIIQGMFHENVAGDIAESGGMGLGDMLFERFQEKYTDFSS
jgi:Rod binding domain-containing protein